MRFFKPLVAGLSAAFVSTAAAQPPVSVSDVYPQYLWTENDSVSLGDFGALRSSILLQTGPESFSFCAGFKFIPGKDMQDVRVSVPSRDTADVLRPAKDQPYSYGSCVAFPEKQLAGVPKPYHWSNPALKSTLQTLEEKHLVIVTYPDSQTRDPAYKGRGYAGFNMIFLNRQPSVKAAQIPDGPILPETIEKSFNLSSQPACQGSGFSEALFEFEGLMKPTAKLIQAAQLRKCLN